MSRYGMNSRYLSNQTKKPAHNRPPRTASVGEVWIAKDVRFDGGEGCKDRPVIVAGSDGDAILCYHCTTQASMSRDRYLLFDPEHAGLDRNTFVDLEMKRLPSAKLSNLVGRLSPEDIDELGLRRSL